jgi:hypothetical protein
MFESKWFKLFVTVSWLGLIVRTSILGIVPDAVDRFFIALAILVVLAYYWED